MEFWGTEVAPGEPEVCHPGDEMYCHVSQAALGPSQSGKSERVVVRVETGGKDVILGTLSSGKCDQMALDLIFDREFKLSHSSTSSSVYFCGYKTEKGEAEDFESEMEDEDEEESEEEAPDLVPMKANGGAKFVAPGKVVAEMVKKGTKGPVKTVFVDVEAGEGEGSDEEDDDEEDDDDSDVDDSDEFDEDDSDEEDESEDEEMASPEISKKRPFKQIDAKTPISGKKARVDTPAKPGLAASPGKKAEKGAAKAAAAAALSTPGKATLLTPGGKKTKDGKEAKKDHKTPPSVKTPKSSSKTSAAKSEAGSSPGSGKKSSGPHKCDACNRAFATEAGATQHMNAKHGTPTSGK